MSRLMFRTGPSHSRATGNRSLSSDNSPDPRACSSRMTTVFLAAALALFLAAGALAAQELQVVVQTTSGTVEVQEPGAEWQPVNAGDIIPLRSRISTGFGATAVLMVGSNADITVRPLTRISVAELAEDQGIERSRVDLEVGRVRGDVRRSDQMPTEFELRSPVATASVRGTVFEFDGESLSVTDGFVAMTTPTGAETIVSGGEESETDGIAPPLPPSQSRRNRARVTHVTPSGSAQAPPRQTTGAGETEIEGDLDSPAGNGDAIIDDDPVNGDPIVDDDQIPDNITEIDLIWEF